MSRSPGAGSLHGLLVVDKSPGPTSHDVVDAARRALGERRIGHTGTLDPMATGVLALLIGRATRLAPLLSGQDKDYEGEALLGQATDTYDSTGRPAGPARRPEPLDEAALAAAVAALTGPIQQLPPPFSARKVDGVRLYRHARRGRPVELRPAAVTVHELTVTSVGAGRLRFHSRVSAGTYIRSLVHDLGQALGCGAHMTALRRTRAGRFFLDAALPQANMVAAAEGIREALAADPPPPWWVPLDRIPLDLPVVVLAGAAALTDLEHGRPARLSGPRPAGDLLQARDAGGRLLGLVAPDPADPGRVLPRRVLTGPAPEGL